jgi:hypothetical protein
MALIEKRFTKVLIFSKQSINLYLQGLIKAMSRFVWKQFIDCCVISF